MPAPTAGPQQLLIDVHAAGVGFPDLLDDARAVPDQAGAAVHPGHRDRGRRADARRRGRRSSRATAWRRIAPLGGWAEVALAVAGDDVSDPGRDDVRAGDEHRELPDGRTSRSPSAATLKAGETVLIHGAAGGTGTAAIEVARGYGATVIAVARGEDKLRTCRELGAEHCDRRGERLAGAR